MRGLTISESPGDLRGVRLPALAAPSLLGEGRGRPPVEPKIRNKAERHALG